MKRSQRYFTHTSQFLDKCKSRDHQFLNRTQVLRVGEAARVKVRDHGLDKDQSQDQGIILSLWVVNEHQ